MQSVLIIHGIHYTRGFMFYYSLQQNIRYNFYVHVLVMANV